MVLMLFSLVRRPTPPAPPSFPPRQQNHTLPQLERPSPLHLPHPPPHPPPPSTLFPDLWPLTRNPPHPNAHRQIVLALPITIIGANFDEEYRASKKLEHERRKVMMPPHTHSNTSG